METRNRVLESARRLNYRNLPVTTFPIEKSRTIRLLRIVKHGHIVDLANTTLISGYIDGLEAEAKSAGWRLEISSHDHFVPADLIRPPEDGSVAGLIVCGTELSESDVAAFESAPMPVVFFDTLQPNERFDFVATNNEATAFSVVSYLHGLGHRRIGLVTGTIENPNFRIRERSFRQAMERRGLRFDERDLFSIDPLYDKGSAEMDALLKSRDSLPTAIFCLADFLAYSCIKALRANGVSIPRDLSIVGFDDMPSSRYLEPPLTSVGIRRDVIGRRAMQLMLRRIDDPSAPCEQVLVGGKLVVRDSVREVQAR